MWYYVYVLDCADGKPYIGYTANLKERLSRHRKGQVRFTCERLPIKLRCAFAFRDQYKALSFEKYLKSGSGRAFAKRHF